ncbi:hypothetical protein [Helicobacter pylori]|uniref:hypothetical protein n=1 Tax=Helicobacter pylori TaxID=210 RepID=UPI000AA507B6|nr:hypothetical protein [Helicobacter pylori]
MRHNYDFLEITDETRENILTRVTNKRFKAKFKAEIEVAEAKRLARQNMPRYRVKFSSLDSYHGGVGGYVASRIREKYSRCRIPSTSDIILYRDEIEEWEREALEQGLGSSFKAKKKK